MRMMANKIRNAAVNRRTTRARGRGDGWRRRCVWTRASAAAPPASSSSSSSSGVEERKRKANERGEEWGEGIAGGGAELLVDIDDVLSDVNRAGGLASVVFGPDSPLVEGEEAFMNIEQWREIKMDFSEEDRNADHDGNGTPMMVDAGEHDSNLLGGGGVDANASGGTGGVQSARVSAYDSKQGFKELDAEALRAKMDSLRANNEEAPIIIDVRSSEEFRATNGSIVADAVNVPIDEISARVQDGSFDIYRGKFIVMVCGSGLRSAQATVRLSKLFAFDNVYNLVGGLEAAKAVFEA